jgi:hypothetical protein
MLDFIILSPTDLLPKTIPVNCTILHLFKEAARVFVGMKIIAELLPHISNLFIKQRNTITFS